MPLSYCAVRFILTLRYSGGGDQPACQPQMIPPTTDQHHLSLVDEHIPGLLTDEPSMVRRGTEEETSELQRRF